jgi:4-amino-4-deoxy-L-arabinose transferase-like glycosyltransferase
VRRNRFTRWPRALPYLLIFLGFTLRLYHIAYQSFWWDEAYSLHMAQDGLAVMLGLPSSVMQVHWDQPPLYYGLLYIWMRLAGVSEFSLRYLSLFFGVLLLPVVYWVGRRLFDRSTALAAMAVTVFSPLYVVYSQEVRVYAVLPLLYLLLVYVLHRLVETDGSNPLRLWIGLAVVEALLLYAHFFAALGVLYVNLALLTVWLWRRGKFSLRHWIGSQALAAALFAPWAWKMILNWDYFRTRGSVREPWDVPPGLLTFAQRIWHFTASGNEAAMEGVALLSTGAGVLALAAVLAMWLTSLDDDYRRRTWAVLGHSLVPLTFCFGLWQIWPDAQPRYTLVFSAPFFLVIGRSLTVMLTQRRRAFILSRLNGALLVVSLLLTFGAGLWVQYFDERFHKDDARAVAVYLREAATAQDVVLVGPGDYSVPYYYDGPASVAMARDEPRADKVHHLSEITAGKWRFFLVRWKPSKADLHELRPFLLEQAGRLEAWRDFRGLDVRVYALASPTGLLPELHDTQARFGPLLLTGTFYEPTATTDNAIAVALRWRLVEPTDAACKIVVMLTDDAGRRLSSADVLLLDEAGYQTNHWPTGAETVNFYVVPVPVGTPSLPHHLVVGVYDAETLARLPLEDVSGQSETQDLILGEAALSPGQHFDGDPYGTWTGVDWETPLRGGVAEGMLLERFSVFPRAALPGSQVTVLLRWRAEGETRPPVSPQLRLSQGEQVWGEVGSSLLTESYSADRWSAGEVVVERRELIYPPRCGPADLSLVVDNGHISLGQVELDEAALLWELPPQAQNVGVPIGDFAELLGYELETSKLTVGQPLTAGQPFRLTIYWRALNENPLETSYTVFTQLLAADGHLIAQHDSPPAENERPTTTWVSGEVVEDVHELTFHDAAYTGPAMLIVGLYDSATVTRVSTAQGQDHVALPVTVVVVAND